MAYRVSVDTVKPSIGWFGYFLAGECTGEFYKILEEKDSWISVSFNLGRRVSLYTIRTNLSVFLEKFCNPKELQEYRFQALECDYGDLYIQDSYLIAAVTNQYSADAYCLLQREDLKFPFSIYDPDFIRSIDTQEKYDALEAVAEDGYLTCQEANAIVGCTVCFDCPEAVPCIG